MRNQFPEKKTAANCFSRMLSQRELINYINFFFYVYFYLFENSLSRGQFKDEPRKVHNEVLHNNDYYYEIKSMSV